MQRDIAVYATTLSRSIGARPNLGAILPLHDVRYHARALTPWRLHAHAEFVFLTNEPETRSGGARRDRTDDLLLAKQALSQLSYGPGPSAGKMVGLGRLELPTSRLSSARSNQLSYKPVSGSLPYQDQRPARISVLSGLSLPGRGSFVKKEKRRRRCPANGLDRS